MFIWENDGMFRATGVLQRVRRMLDSMILYTSDVSSTQTLKYKYEY